MSKKSSFLEAAIDFHLVREGDKVEAVRKALEDYVYVYHPEPGDNRTPLQRSAQRALERVEEYGWD